MTASLHDQPALAREERVARCRRKASPTLVVPGHALESHQRRLAASDFSKQVGNVVLRQMSEGERRPAGTDRKSTRLNSSHTVISYAVFCLKKKKKKRVKENQQATEDGDGD